MSGSDRALTRALGRAYRDLPAFSRLVLARPLRPYQLEPARAIAASVRAGRGLSFAVIFSRQAGKDELLAQLEAYLLNLYQLRGGSVVMGSPTFKPQCLVSRGRLLERLDNPFNRGRARTRDGYVVQLGRASCRFLSTDPAANVRGETASLALICNEAQDVPADRWDAVFDPMGASTNATTVFSGTVWTSSTLLARQMAYLQERSARDGIQRVFKVDWEQVAQVLPAYGERVRERIRQLGRTHPFIKSEYFLEEIDGEGGMFPPPRRAQLRGNHSRRHQAEPGRTYALLLDVAGEDEREEGEELRAAQPRRDSTALTVVEVDLATVADPLVLRPTYRVVDRRQWTGTKHPALYATLLDLARNVWHARQVVVDATGVGAGLASFLGRALGGALLPFVFNRASKSALGWDFLAVCDTGRFKDHADDGSPEQALFWRQVENTRFEIGAGPGKLVRWSVPDPTLHDDFVISAALCAALEGLDWRPRRASGTFREEG